MPRASTGSVSPRPLRAFRISSEMSLTAYGDQCRGEWSGHGTVCGMQKLRAMAMEIKTICWRLWRVSRLKHKRNVPKHHLIKGNLLCFMLDISRHHIFLSYCHVYPHKFPSDWSQKSWKSCETFPEELSAPVQSTTNIATSDILGQLCQDLRAASAILATKMPLKRVQPDDMLPEGLAGFGKSKSK